MSVNPQHAEGVCQIDIGAIERDAPPMTGGQNVDDFYETFGRRVALRRREVDLSQAVVAQKLELTRASISNLEAGRQRPVLHQAAALAAALDISLLDLLPANLPEDHDPDRDRLDAIRRKYSAFASDVE